MNDAGEKRARDDDRDRVVAALDDAYVDGQIDADEREARVAATLGARTLGELAEVVADLQVEEVLPEPEPESEPSRGRFVIATVAAVAVVGFVGWQIVGDGSDAPDASTGSMSEAESAVSDEHVLMWSDVEGELGTAAPSRKGIRVPQVGAWTATEADIRALIETYRDKRGDFFIDASFRPEYATLKQPLAGADPAYQTWSFYPHDPVLRASEAASSGLRDQAVIDFRDVDLDRLFENLESALTELNVEDARLLYISMGGGNGSSQVQIYVRNGYQETGYLNTTLDGEITQKYAFSGG